MSILNDCCQPCPTPPVNVPGAEGPAGSNGQDGSDGVSAFTVTTSDFSLPSANGSVTASVANSSWMVPGENVFISDGTQKANFRVSSLPGTDSVVLVFLNYTGDSSTGATIASGAGVTPSGLQGTAGAGGFTVAGTISAAVGLSQALTVTPNTQVGSVSLTLAAASSKTYLLFARCRFDYVGAAFAANQTINFKLRRTNGTPGDVANAVGNRQTDITIYPETLTFSVGEITIVAVPYTTQGVSDIIQPMASINATPSAGSVEAVECSLSAVELT